MTTGTTAMRPMRRIYAATIGDLGDLLMEQPHQGLLSIASITMIAAEAGLVVPFPANIALAVGVEWAFLRGAASARRVSTWWLHGLNWGAAAILLIYGSLWSLRKFALIPERPEAWAGWTLTALHILPVFWITLAAGQAHAAMLRAEASQAAAEADRRQAFDQAQQEKDRELDRWKEAQRLKAELRRADASMPVASAKMPAEAVATATKPLVCPACGAALASVGEYGAARRWGRCKHCKEA